MAQKAYRTGPAERSVNPGPDVEIAPTLAGACMAVRRARDSRTFACARPIGHDGEHYGVDGSGPVRLGFGR